MITKQQIMLLDTNYDFTIKTLSLVSKDIAGHIFDDINFIISHEECIERGNIIICGRSYLNTIEILLYSIVKNFGVDWAIKQSIIHTCIHESFHLIISRSPMYVDSDIEGSVESATFNYIKDKKDFLEKELNEEVNMKFHKIFTQNFYKANSIVPRVSNKDLWGTFFTFICKSETMFSALDTIEESKYENIYIDIYKDGNCIVEEELKIKNIILPIPQAILKICNEDIKLNQSIKMSMQIYYDIDTKPICLINVYLTKKLRNPLIKL